MRLRTSFVKSMTSKSSASSLARTPPFSYENAGSVACCTGTFRRSLFSRTRALNVFRSKMSMNCSLQYAKTTGISCRSTRLMGGRTSAGPAFVGSTNSGSPIFLNPEYWLHALSQFDHVFIGCEGTVEAVSQAIGRRCHWIGGGVDAVRFSPYPDPPTRVIDVYRIGRTSQQVHEGLVRAAASNELFYLHDTCRGSHMDTLDHREHRRLLANIAKRSRYFVVGPGKVDAPEETRGQIELGYRYYEGSAAGAVMIGHAADCRSFRERFDWRDAVIHVNGSDVVDVIADLNAQPDRLREIGRRNAAEALMRHDWLYRWMHIYDIAGVSPTRRMAERECHLKALARLANNDHRLRTIEVSGARRNRHVE